ncbi:MAG: aminotransferase class I/II-fold pyridoxal phosphate-dependent enzyme, partial [Deltaproteobacteria bacterium]
AIYLISDEPYREIAYNGVKVPNIISHYDNSIIAYSYSKSMSIPGERIGYVLANPLAQEVDKLVDGFVFCNRILGFVNAPALLQRVIATTGKTQVDVKEYQRKRDMLCDGLADIGYKFTKPEGAFYLFPKTPIIDDVKFVGLLQTKRILTVPGSGFGAHSCFRIAYCVDDETISNSMKGFGEAFRECKES